MAGFVLGLAQQPTEIAGGNRAVVAETFAGAHRDHRADGLLAHDRAFEQVEALHQMSGVQRA